MACGPTTGWLITARSKRDADIISSGPVFRRLRRRRRLALSGAARNRSFWYPTWLAQPAALVEGSRLVDAPPHGKARRSDGERAGLRPRGAAHLDTVVRLRRRRPSRRSRQRTAPENRPVGAKVAVEPAGTLECLAHRFRRPQRVRLHHQGSRRRTPWPTSPAWLPQCGRRHRAQRRRPILENMDSLPFVTPVYKRDLKSRTTSSAT